MSPEPRQRHNKSHKRELKHIRRTLKTQHGILAKRRKQISTRQHAEDVHQMRIAARKVRATLGVLDQEKSKLAKEVRWLTGKLGRVRDLEVQMQLLGKSKAERRYRAHLKSQWKPARRRLIRALQTKRTKQLLESLHALPSTIDKNTPLSLHKTIHHELKHIKRSGNHIRKDSPFERLHHLRLRCKRIRYHIEILQPSSDSALNKTLTGLKVLLEQLGALQDTRVTVSFLLAYEDTLGADDTDHKQLDRMLAKQQRRAEKIRHGFPDEWQRFEKTINPCLAELRQAR